MNATASNQDKSPFHRQVHGRTKSGKLSPRKQKLVDELLPRLLAPTVRAPGSLDPRSLFSGDIETVWLEIGFGGGEHLAWQAEQNPDIGFIGCEPFINGVAKLLTEVEERGLENVRIHDDDATALLDGLPDASIDRLFLLHPDPWPKKRHWKRRFINDDNLARIARVLKPGGEFRFASDIPHYVGWTLRHMARRDDFRWTATCCNDWRTRPADWPATRYGEKALRQGRPPAHLLFVRV